MQDKLYSFCVASVCVWKFLFHIQSICERFDHIKTLKLRQYPGCILLLRHIPRHCLPNLKWWPYKPFPPYVVSWPSSCYQLNLSPLLLYPTRPLQRLKSFFLVNFSTSASTSSSQSALPVDNFFTILVVLYYNFISILCKMMCKSPYQNNKLQ